MTKLLCFFFGINCLIDGRIFTGLLFLYICLAKDFKR
jgi:hypothetical protein